MAEMTDSELASLVNAKVDDGKHFVETDEISDRQIKSLDYWRGKKTGILAARPNRSSIILTETQDTIEWIVPQILRLFVQTNRVVTFTPQDKEDVDKAEQETEAVNHVVMQQNKGFSKVYTVLKDGQFPRGGFLKIVWGSPGSNNEQYARLSKQEFEELRIDPRYKILESEEEVNDVLESLNEDGTTDVRDIDFDELESQDKNNLRQKELLGQVRRSKISRWKVRFRVKESDQVIISNPAPENMVVDQEATWDNIYKARYVAEVIKMTESDLIEMGVDRDLAKSLPTAEDTVSDNEAEANARSDNQVIDDTTDEVEGAARLVEVTDFYGNVDFDGDDIAELRRVIVSGGHILENKEIDRHPYHYFTSVPITHIFYGWSTADQTNPIQEIKSVLTRQILESAYLSTNRELIINKNLVNLVDITTRRPGGFIQVDGGTENVRELPHAPLPPEAFQMLTYMDQVRLQRTGSDNGESTLNPDALKQINIPATRGFFEARTTRVEMQARIFAECTFKPAMLHIHELLRKHQDRPMMFRLRNEFVETDPRNWKERTDMSIMVGLGTGNKDIQFSQLMQILAEQKETITALGPSNRLTSLDKVFNTHRRMAELAGFKNVNEFWSDPLNPSEETQKAEQQQQESQQQQQQQLIEQQQAQLQQLNEQIQFSRQLEMAKLQQTGQLEMAKLQQDGQKDQSDANLKQQEIDNKTEKGLLDVQTDRTEQELKSGQDVPGAVV